MNTAFTSGLAHAISDKLVETAKNCPTRIKAAMYLHYDTPSYGNTQKSLLQLTMQAMLWKLCKKHEIKFVRNNIIDAPIKGATLYEFEFSTKDNRAIYCYQLTNGYPTSPIEILALSLQESIVEKGCSNCGFGATLSEDETCNFCMNGKTRNILNNMLGDKAFRVGGWRILSEIIGSNYAHALLDLAKFHEAILVNEDFRNDCANITQNASEDIENFGSYLGEHVENVLFLNMENVSDDEEEEEDDCEEHGEMEDDDL